VGAGLVVAAGLLAGCGDSAERRYAVSGTVTYKGQPIANGLISFMPRGTDASAGGSAIVNGKYTIPSSVGLLAGEYDVVVSVPTATPAKAAGDDEAPGEGGERETGEALPARYNLMTELKAEVKAEDKNQFDFHLE
jgi:hypothetical protein